VLTALAAVTVVPERLTTPGYDRDCGPGEGCVFGPAWSDDTRNNVLAQQLIDVVYREGTHDCVVIAGVLAEPYTGQRIDFRVPDHGGRRDSAAHVEPQLSRPRGEG
jgi:hypothetical protein